MNKIYKITSDGRKELEKELESLKSRRGEIADKIAEAREHGDLKENAEYDLARSEQGIVETRIAEIEDILQNAEVIKAVAKGKVVIGSKVTLDAGGKKVTYIIVGPIEADPIEGKISNESPIGEAVMGKKVGDKFTLKTAKGETSYEITNIE